MPPRSPELVLGRIHMPRLIAGLIAAIALLSIAAAVGLRNGAPFIAEGSVLLGERVWQGEVWRLVTWALLELAPIQLLFACLTLYWFGGDLVRTWGERRFVGFFFGSAAAAGVCTAMVGLFWPTVGMIPHAGSWAVLDAVIIAWGMLFPGREMRLYGLLRLTGRHLVYVTFGITVLFALFYGLAAFVPHFAAELLTWGWLGGGRRLLTGWQRRRKSTLLARARAFDLNDWIKKDRRRR